MQLVGFMIGVILVVGAVSCEKYEDDYEPYPAEAGSRASAYAYSPQSDYPPQVSYPPSHAGASASADAYASSAYPQAQKQSFLKTLTSHVKDLGRVTGQGARRTLQEARPTLQQIKADCQNALHKGRQSPQQVAQGGQVKPGLKDKIYGLLHPKPAGQQNVAYSQATAYGGTAGYHMPN